MSVNPWDPVVVGDPALRQRNTAICARVTFWVGEKWPGDVPAVISASSSHFTASSKYDPVGTSENP